MPVQITIKVSADPALKRLSKLAQAMTPQARSQMHQKAATQMHSYVMQVFDAEGAFDGRAPWAPLKAGGRWLYTKKRDGRRVRKRFQTDHMILQDTGALRQSFLPLYDSTMAGIGAVSTRKHADLAPIHEFGNPARNLPARPMMPEARAALKIVADIYGYELERASR